MCPRNEGLHDRWTLETLIEEYGDRIYNVALRITCSPQEAEDATQDAFLAAFRHRDSFRSDASPATWLYRIAVNAALQHLRRLHPEVALANTDYERLQVADWSADLSRRAERAELREVIEQGISRLPEEVRVAVVLRDVEGFSTAEAADILELSPAALKSRVHRGRVLLRAFLSDYLDE